MEEHVWYIQNYIDSMTDPKHPLTMAACANAAKESLTGRVKCEALCMGNVNSEEALRLSTVLDRSFLQRSMSLSDVEIPEFRSMKLPTKEEAHNMFGAPLDRPFPLVYQELAYSESEENNAVELILQVGSEYELGYDGLAIFDLIAHVAYNSAFAQLRTKEQLGYIVSAYARRTAGGAYGLAIVVQGGVALPEDLEIRCQYWLNTFRQELSSMSADELAKEASAVVAQLLEKDTKLAQEVGRTWGEILNTEGLPDRIKTPAFNRMQRVAKELMVKEHGDEHGRRTAEELKERALAFFDKHFSLRSPQRRAMSARVYSQRARAAYDEALKEPGVFSKHSDIRYVKQFLGSYPRVPYWRVNRKDDRTSE